MSSKTTAGPRCLRRSGEAALTLTTAPFGARLPLTTARPPTGTNGSSRVAMIERFGALGVTRPSPTTLPVIVIASRWSNGASSAMTAGMPPAWNSCSTRYSPTVDVHDDRGALGQFVEPLETEWDADAPGEGEQMNDRVRRAAYGEEQRDRVVERLLSEYPRRTDALDGDLHGAPSTGLGVLLTTRIVRRYCGTAGMVMPSPRPPSPSSRRCPFPAMADRRTRSRFELANSCTDIVPARKAPCNAEVRSDAELAP